MQDDFSPSRPTLQMQRECVAQLARLRENPTVTSGGLVDEHDDLPVDAFEHRGKSLDQRADIIVLVECRAMVSCRTNANCRTNSGPKIGSLAEHYDPIYPGTHSRLPRRTNLDCFSPKPDPFRIGPAICIRRGPVTGIQWGNCGKTEPPRQQKQVYKVR